MQVDAPPAFSLARWLTWHTGHSSRNKLIVFADGTYLELFCWIDTPREFYAWANKSPGLIDFALTSMPPKTAQSLHKDIVSRLGKEQSGDRPHIGYTPPQAGSRSRLIPCRSGGNRQDQYLPSPLNVLIFHFSVTTSHLEMSESLSTTRRKPIIRVALSVSQASK